MIRDLRAVMSDGGAIALTRIGDPAEYGRFATVVLSSAASKVTDVSTPVKGAQLKVL